MSDIKTMFFSGVACAIASLTLSPCQSWAQSAHPFVDADFIVPERLETAEFRLRMLTVNDVVKDYDAVMSGVEHLSEFWPGSGWPGVLSLEQNLIDLGWHQKEFQRRESFAYTVVSLDETRVLGCVYINPARKRGHDAAVYFWVRQSGLGRGLDGRLSTAVNQWIESAWPLKNPAYPGRQVDWEDWRKFPDEKR